MKNQNSENEEKMAVYISQTVNFYHFICMCQACLVVMGDSHQGAFHVNTMMKILKYNSFLCQEI